MKWHKGILAIVNQTIPQNHTTQQASHKQLIEDKSRLAAASEWEERQQRLGKGKDFYRVCGACSPSLVEKNHDRKRCLAVYTVMGVRISKSWSSRPSQGSCVFLLWHRLLECSQGQGALLLTPFPITTITEAAIY